MASARVAFLAISMVLLCSVAIATDHIVGDDKGWTVDFNYTQWAQDKVFRVGDNLVFNYDSAKHNVFKVNGTLFKDCTFPPVNEALSTGKDVIPLKTEGRKWYICGIKDHCAARQMKFVIDVSNGTTHLLFLLLILWYHLFIGLSWQPLLPLLRSSRETRCFENKSLHDPSA